MQVVLQLFADSFLEFLFSFVLQLTSSSFVRFEKNELLNFPSSSSNLHFMNNVFINVSRNCQEKVFE